MKFCSACQTVVLKIQSNNCRFCGYKLEGRQTKTVYERVYVNEAPVEEIHEYKGTKIRNICDACSSEYMYYKAIQTRGADEGQTVFFECDCGYKKKIDT